MSFANLSQEARPRIRAGEAFQHGHSRAGLTKPEGCQLQWTQSSERRSPSLTSPRAAAGPQLSQAWSRRHADVQLVMEGASPPALAPASSAALGGRWPAAFWGWRVVSSLCIAQLTEPSYQPVSRCFLTAERWAKPPQHCRAAPALRF